MAKRRRKQALMLIHAEAIAKDAARQANTGALWTELLPIAFDVIAKLLPRLMKCITPEKPAAQVLGWKPEGGWSVAAYRQVSAAVRASERRHKTGAHEIVLEWMVNATLSEAIRPTTTLAAVAREVEVE